MPITIEYITMMRLSAIKSNKSEFGAIVACACLLAFAGSVSAGTVTLTVGLGTSDELGEANPGTSNGGGQADHDQALVEQLISMPVNTQSGTDPEYSRSVNTFSSLPAPTLTGDVATTASGMVISGSEVVVTLAADTTYQYLVAGYGGSAHGQEVWDIAGIAAGSTIDIPLDAFPNHQISTWTLFDPASNTSVPDGGVTVTLLGGALVMLKGMRRGSLK
jgi:hypothetical protein